MYIYIHIYVYICIYVYIYNCNIRPGEFPVCRILAPVVLRSLRLEPKNTPVAPSADDSRPNVPPSAVVTTTAPSVASPPRS